ncbi:oxidoreductase [Bacillus sp. UMB0899]|uniref:flavin-containing monooxygenase n=1 Tax=Metabacillus schmidteae TaxID=2730405 RepID=UPI000C80499E|nr:NAD(P)/FAD-dependent oxidoreductase [Metabacillus schmidteae]PMC39055.1 oxidoreductase [Bacillus sp. UMB0899]
MYDTIIIGAGQAGLAVGYYLKQFNKNFILLDKGHEVGESWKERYDSLVLFTPRMYSGLPGMKFQGELHSLPTKGEVVDYLGDYAEKFNIPIHFQTEVESVSKMDGHFFIETNKGEYVAKNLVIATGPFHIPSIPPLSKKLSGSINQLHSSHYRNPKQLVDGNVLVVGGGNSGAQIAVEISKERETFLAVSQKLSYFPLFLLGKSIFWWFDKLGILKATNTSFLGQLIQKRGDPIFGFELKDVIKQGNIKLKKRVTDGNQHKVFFEDSSELEIQNIIWATGFKTDFSWLKIDHVMNHKGHVIHNRGVTNIKGLYLIGLPWQYRRGSALLEGVGYDAEYIVEKINSPQN